MTALLNAMNKTAHTENGALTHFSSMDHNVDLFFKAGASRGKDISDYFLRAFAENEDIAIRIALWMRDAREGAGERQQFKNFINKLIEKDDYDLISRIILKIPELGRFDDLMAFWNTKYEEAAVAVWINALSYANGLAFKWCPRKDKKGAKPLRKALGLSEAEWRKFVVANTEVVEQKMCSKQWGKIDYSKIPSLAAARYQKAFFRNDNERYNDYVESLKNGETKINAGAVYPYDIVISAYCGDVDVATEQWKALPNWLEGSEEKLLPVIDVSASMTWFNVTPSANGRDVALGLGLYLAERNTSIFKDQFITFSSTPKMHKVIGGNLKERIENAKHADIGGTTDLALTFETLLNAAVQNKVAKEDMPTKIVILSDMEFDQATSVSKNGSLWGREPVQETLFENIKNKYSKAGYEMPQIVFWNLNSRRDNVPVTIGTGGTALVSGFSPTIMKSLMSGVLEPRQVMLDTVMKERYNY